MIMSEKLKESLSKIESEKCPSIYVSMLIIISDLDITFLLTYTVWIKSTGLPKRKKKNNLKKVFGRFQTSVPICRKNHRSIRRALHLSATETFTS